MILSTAKQSSERPQAVMWQVVDCLCSMAIFGLALHTACLYSYKQKLPNRLTCTTRGLVAHSVLHLARLCEVYSADMPLQ